MKGDQLDARFLRLAQDHDRYSEDPKTLSDEYIRTGTEVEAIDTVGESFDHVVTAKVLTKTPHPDSDHMYVCSVDVGDKNLDADGSPAPLQIVCGAQNFEAGDHIVTAMIGAVLPSDVKIKKSKLRGVVSMGMNCSARELGRRRPLRHHDPARGYALRHAVCRVRGLERHRARL